MLSWSRSWRKDIKKDTYHLILQLKHTVHTENWKTISRGSSISYFTVLTICWFCYSSSWVYKIFIPPTSALFLSSSSLPVPLQWLSRFLLILVWLLDLPVGHELLSSTSLMATIVRENLSQGSWPLCNLPHSSASCQTPSDRAGASGNWVGS